MRKIDRLVRGGSGPVIVVVPSTVEEAEHLIDLMDDEGEDYDHDPYPHDEYHQDDDDYEEDEDMDDYDD